MISEPTNSLEKERTKGERERERPILLGERALLIEDMTWRKHFLCGTFWKKMLVIHEIFENYKNLKIKKISEIKPIHKN